VDDATHAVMPPDPEMIQVGDAIWQRPQWRGLVQGAVRPVLQGCKSDSFVAALRDRGFARCTCATVVAHVVSGVALGR
jgi:hypothetical protein